MNAFDIDTLAELELLDEEIRDHRENAAAIRAKSLRLSESRACSEIGETPLDRRRELDRLFDESVRESNREAKALRELNDLLLAGGSRYGEKVVIGKGEYMAVTGGNPALYLGREVPEGEPEDDADTDRDDVAERAREYSQMVSLA